MFGTAPRSMVRGRIWVSGSDRPPTRTFGTIVLALTVPHVLVGVVLPWAIKPGQYRGHGMAKANKRPG